jgi:hypothetical protein
MPIPWPASLFPVAPLLALAAAIAGGVLGAHVGGALSSPRRPSGMPRFVPGIALAVLIACLAIPMHTTAGPPVRAAVALDQTRPGPGREVMATVRLDPADAADDAKWFNAMAWQGGGSRLVHLRRIGPGTYRTTEPVPVHGDWKAMLRLHTGSSILALPIYMPGDPAIPAREIPAPAHFERTFQLDHEVLRREEKGAASWLTGAAYGALGVIALAWLVAIGAAVARFERRSGVAAVA